MLHCCPFEVMCSVEEVQAVERGVVPEKGIRSRLFQVLGVRLPSEDTFFVPKIEAPASVQDKVPRFASGSCAENGNETTVCYAMFS